MRGLRPISPKTTIHADLEILVRVKIDHNKKTINKEENNKIIFQN